MNSILKRRNSNIIFPAIALILLFLSIGVFLPRALSAKMFRVNSGFDVNDLNPGDGHCVAYLVIFPPFVLPYCTFRGAIGETNNLPGADSIELSSGFYRFELSGSDEDSGLTGDIDITDSLIISGAGADQTFIDGKSLDRVVDIHGEDTRVVLRNLTIMNGSVPSDGGLLRNQGELVLENVVLLDGESNRFRGRGGLIYNSGHLTLGKSTMQNGRAHEGGGLFNSTDGVAALSQSTLSFNNASSGAAAMNAGFLELVNSTVSNNGDEATQTGGGIENSGSLSLKYVTVTENEALEGGGIFNSHLVYLQNTIVAGNIGSDCNRRKFHFSYGYNLDSDDSCFLDHERDLPGKDPGLRPLSNYGGYTMTHTFYPFSPARNNGAATGVSFDQRGVPRPVGERTDIGAVESDGNLIAPNIMPILLK
jgi:hypothetical protein